MSYGQSERKAVPMGEHNSTFISYRHEVADSVALALYQELNRRGIDVFLDFENINAGEFETVILSQIASRPYFVPVWSPGTLDRCVEPKDWVRREIEHAMGCGRIIVPVYTPRFDPADLDRFLPLETAQRLKILNRHELPIRWFRYSCDELCERFLKPTRLSSAAAPQSLEPLVSHHLAEVAARPAVTAVKLHAQEIFERALTRPSTEQAEKIADFSEVLRLDPRSAAAMTNRGNCSMRLGDIYGAITDYESALRVNPAYASAFYNRGCLFSQLGDHRRAIADFSSALAINSFFPDALNNRGTARLRILDFNGAIADFTAAYAVHPGFAKTLHNRGNARYAIGDTDGAISDYTEALRIDPSLSRALLNRGVVREAKGDHAGALADYSKAIEIDPNYADAFNNRGLVRQKQGDRDGAIQDYAEALRRNPRHELATQNMASVQRKRWRWFT